MPPSHSAHRPMSPTTPRRRPLHERSQSQTNGRSLPTTVRLIQNQDSQDETSIFSTTPYPTKPEHVLLPPAGGNQGSICETGHNVSHLALDPIRSPGSSVRRDQSLSDHGLRDASGQASTTTTLHGTVSSNHTWDDSLDSSKTSIPHSSTSYKLDSGRQNKEERNDDNSSDSDGVQLPPTIKVVTQNLSSPATASPTDSTYAETVPADGRLSPSLIPTGLTSSPTFRPIEPSSPNFIPLRRSSPTESSLFEVNSVGTVRRYIRAGQRNSTLTDASSSELQSVTPSPSIPSSPPNAALRSYQSTTSFNLPHPTSFRLNTTSSASSGSSRSIPDGQSSVGSRAPVQYPVIRYPQTSSRAETSLVRSMIERFSGGLNPHLSTIPSEWSAERLQSLSPPSPRDDLSDGSGTRGSSEPKRHASSSPSARPVDKSKAEEHSDNLTHLRSLPLRQKTSGTLSHSSSLSALSNPRNFLRSPSNSSILHTIPTWARVYYRSGGLGPQFASLFTFESRPSTPPSPPSSAISAKSAAYNSNPPPMVSRTPLGISNPRVRPREISYPPRPGNPTPPEDPDDPDDRVDAIEPVDPTDPRVHWVPDLEQFKHPKPMENLPGAWSPHLYTDKRANNVRRSMWKPPSLDEKAEGLISRRNVQVYAFALGFVFPLAWIIASFLPLPPQVSEVSEEATTSRPDLEHAFRNRVVLVDQTRHENARWWRRVNRFMFPIGLAVIAIVVALAVLLVERR
ncbi:hypothetical protein GX48_07624 [Paracoccidioides brasiliensis]|nr:hypothetical protein GX48_07624 [Paracoccidioides brasiliensis]